MPLRGREVADAARSATPGGHSRHRRARAPGLRRHARLYPRRNPRPDQQFPRRLLRRAARRARSSATARRCGSPAKALAFQHHLGRDHRQRLRQPPRSDRRLALRLRDVRRSQGARHAHRPAGCTRNAARWPKSANSRASCSPGACRTIGATVARSRRPRGLSRAGDRGQAARPRAALPARQRLRARAACSKTICPKTSASRGQRGA